jgi:hypothetical protein
LCGCGDFPLPSGEKLEVRGMERNERLVARSRGDACVALGDLVMDTKLRKKKIRR